MHMKKRDFFLWAVAAGASQSLWAKQRGAPATTQPSIAAPAPATGAANPTATSAESVATLAVTNADSQTPFVIALNEGVTYHDPSGTAGDRFADLSADLEKLLKRPVQIKLIRQYPELVEGLRQDAYDLAYVHPAHHAIRAITQDGYSLVALTKGFTEYRASFMVKGDSPLQTLADLRRHKVGGPAEDSITSVMTRATLRDVLGNELPKLIYVRYQDAVPFMIENNLAAAGVSASKAVVKKWQDKGGRVLFTSKPVPIKQLLASGRVSAEQRAELTRYFVTLERTEAGKNRLRSLHVPGFVEFNQSELLPIGAWLEA